MTLESRIARLEAHPVTGRMCQCPRGAVSYRDGISELGGTPVDDTCPRCGLSRGYIPIMLTSFDYGDGPHALPVDEHGKTVFDYAAAIAAIAPAD